MSNKYDPYNPQDSGNTYVYGPTGAQGTIKNKYNLAEPQNDGPTTGGEIKYLNTNNNENILQATSLHGIFGIPYQFMDSVDRRVSVKDKTSMGRKYIEKIMVHAPLLMITPCRQKFMEGFGGKDKETFLASLATGNVDALNNINKIGRYYTTSFAYDEYYTAVRIMCMEVAHFLGIDDVVVTYGNKRTKIGDIDWYSQKNEAFSNYFAAKNATVWYVDGLVELSDSFSNTTTDSLLAATVNQFSDQAKELRFVASGSALSETLKGLFEGAGDTINNVIHTIAPNLTSGMLGDLASTGVSSIVHGGRIIFPKIWGDSSYSRTYNFNIKLRSPDHDTVSIFFNILVPYIHMLALTLPQSITNGTAAQNPNAYDTPFLVRSYCKGMFNINMGIITDLSATRGAEAQWNDQGLPTQIDLSISIEDLYSNLVMSNPGHKTGNIFKNMWYNHIDVVTNTEMIDFLSNMCGLNIAAESPTRKIELFKQLTVSKVKWLPSQIFHYFESAAANAIRYIYDRLM